MTAREAFVKEYEAILECTPAMTLSTMYAAFCRGYGYKDNDAERYRYIRDEAIQDSEKQPLALAIAILDKEPNEVGNYNIVSWGVTYDVDADDLIDQHMAARKLRLEGKLDKDELSPERTPNALDKQVKAAQDLIKTWSPEKKASVQLQGHDIYAPEWPQEGDLVRYDQGSTALAIRGKPHAGGWYGAQCMGGSTYFNKAYRPSQADIDTWNECAKWRRGA
jgi:hypothetical protein